MADEQSRLPFNEQSFIPKGFDWVSLLAKDGDELEILHSVGTVDRRCSHDIHLGLFQFLRPRSLAVSSLSRSSSPLLSRSIDAAIARVFQPLQIFE